jgi:hypothetical protein
MHMNTVHSTSMQAVSIALLPLVEKWKPIPRMAPELDEA